MKKAIGIILCLLLTTLPLAACSAPSAGSSTPENSGRLQVVATIFPYYDFARAVAGSSDGITLLLKPGAESHSYDPSPADIITMENADIFLYTGGHNDEWAQNLISPLAEKQQGPAVLRMMDFIGLVEEDEKVAAGLSAVSAQSFTHEEGTEHWDEHIWTSPLNAIEIVKQIEILFAEKDPENAAVYKTNANRYTLALQTLDEEFRNITQNSKRNLLVFGDRFPFRYFTEEYSLTYMAAFPGCSVDSNPSAGTVAALVEAIKQNQLPYIYTIELSNQSIAKVLAAETGCEILRLHSCQTVTKEEFDSGETYLSLMRQNAENLRKGLN